VVLQWATIGPVDAADQLWLEMEEQDAIADACGVAGLGNLECHEAAIRGDHRI